MGLPGEGVALPGDGVVLPGEGVGLGYLMKGWGYLMMGLGYLVMGWVWLPGEGVNWTKHAPMIHHCLRIGIIRTTYNVVCRT